MRYHVSPSMATTPFSPDFAGFLKLLSSHGVEFLPIGGYAVGLHRYPRGTADLDIWVAMTLANAQRIVDALQEFRFNTSELHPSLFLQGARREETTP